MTEYKTIDDLKNAMSENTLKAYINYWGNDNELKRFLSDSYVNSSLTEYIKSRNIEVKGKRVLEFGCRDGSSFITFLLLDAEKIVGVDIDKNVLELSKMIYSDFGYNNIEYRINEINENLPVKDEEFDIISCNAVFEHIHPELRNKYILELQRKLKTGGYFIVSDSPNKLWLKEGHTTGIWFLNFMPFRLKCRLASKTKRHEGIKPDNYDYWIEQGIEGVSYRNFIKYFSRDKWNNDEDRKFKREYFQQIFNNVNRKFIKRILRYILFMYALFVDIIYLRPMGYPGLAISPSLLFSFKKRDSI